MYQKAFLILGIIILAKLSFLSAETIPEKLDLYIDKNAASSSPDGSVEKPFLEFYACLEFISKSLSTATRFNVYIAPANEDYILTHSLMIINSGQLPKELTISLWKDRSEGQNLPNIHLMENYLRIVNIAVTFTSFNVKNNDGLIIFESCSSVIMENMNFPELGPKISVISLRDCHSFTLKNSSAKVDKGMEFFTFLTKNEQNPTIIIEDLKIYYDNIFYEEESNKRTSIINLIRTQENVKIAGTVTMKEVYLQSSNPENVAHAKALFTINGFKKVLIEGLFVENQNFAFTNSVIGNFNDITELIVNNLNFQGNKIKVETNLPLLKLRNGVQSFISNDIVLSNNVINVKSGLYFNLFEAVRVPTLKFRKHSLTGNIIHGNMQLIRTHNNKDLDIKTNKLDIDISDLVISDNNNIESTNYFNYFKLQGSVVKTMTLQNIEYSKNKLSGRVFSFQNQLEYSPQDGKIRSGYSEIRLRDIVIKDNLEAIDTSFYYFIPFYSSTSDIDCNYVIDPFRTTITNFTLTNNKFARGKNIDWVYETSFFQMMHTQIKVEKSVFAKNSFYLYTVFKTEEKPSVISIIRSNFTNNEFHSSQLINSNYRKVNQPCSAKEATPGYKIPLLYRHNAIAFCTFSNIKVISSSLLTMNNAFMILHRNSFDNIILSHNSKLISTVYMPVRLPPGCSGLERNLNGFEFQIFDDLAEYYKDISNQHLLYEKDPSYFYSMDYNSFTNIKFNASTLISLKGFGFLTSFIRVHNNNFTELVATTDSLNTIFACESLDVMVISYNEFKIIKGNFVGFSLPQSQRSSFLKVIGNDVFNVTTEIFLTYTGEKLSNATINENTFDNITCSAGLIFINAKSIFEDIQFNYNIITGVYIAHEKTKYQIENSRLIYIYTGPSYRITTLFFNDNVIDWVTAIFSTYIVKVDPASMIVFDTQQFIEFQNNKISNVFYDFQGSIVYVTKSKRLMINNCRFELIAANGPKGMITTSASETVVINSVFSDIMNSGMGGALYLVPPSSENFSVSIENCLFEDISIFDLGKIFTAKPSENFILPKSSMKLSTYGLKFSFRNNTLSRSLYTTSISFHNATCMDCIIQNSSFSLEQFNVKSFEGLVLAEGAFGRLIIRDVNLPTFKTEVPYLFSVKSSEINLQLEDLVIKGDETYLYLANLDSGILTIKNSIFENFKIIYKPIISIEKMVEKDDEGTSKNKRIADIIMENTTFRHVYGPPDNSLNKNESLIQFMTYRFSYNAKNYKPAILSSSMPFLLQIKNCTFENLQNTNTLFFPASLASMLCNNNTITIEDTTFRNLHSLMGSAITVLPDNCKHTFHISNTNFINCSAYVGGALALYFSELKMSHSKFINVSAELLGAAIYKGGLFSPEFDLTNNLTFVNVSSKIDNKIGYEPTFFKLSFVSDTPNGIIFNTFLKKDSTETYVMNNVSNSEFQAGSLLIHYLYKEDSNAYDTHEIALSRNVLFQISVKDSFNVFPVTVLPVDTFTSRIPLKNITLIGQANETIYLKIDYESTKLKQTIKINITLRECLPGEYYNNLICEPCKYPTYSLNPSISCTKCPLYADCTNPARIYPVSGYWNANDSSTVIVECPDIKNGKNGRCHAEKDTGNRNCKEGYTGPYCSGCDFNKNYVESGFFECEVCNDPLKSLVISSAFAFAYFIYRIFSIYVIYKGAYPSSSEEDLDNLEKRQIDRSFYMKSLISYGQFMSTICITSPHLYKHLGLASQIGNPSFLITYGTQCALKALGFDYNNFIYSQTYFILAVPFLEVPLISAAFYLLSKCIKSIKMKKVLSCTILFIIILHHPGIATTLALFLSCATVKELGYRFIASHVNWSCDDLRYINASTFIIIPNLALWCIVIPFAILYLLRSNRSNPNSENPKGSVGTLLVGLKEKNYYWELVMMFIKATTSVMIAGHEMQLEIQVFSFLLLLWIYQSLIRIFSPYKTKTFNGFEIFMTNVLIFNIIVIKCLLNEAGTPTMIEVSLVMAVAVNVFFVLYILGKILVLTLFKKSTMLEERLIQEKSDPSGHPSNRISIDSLLMN